MAMVLSQELAKVRREQGLSQAALATLLDAPRIAITRLESGVGSAGLALRAMEKLNLRLASVAKGSSLPDQMKNRRMREGLSIGDAARLAKLDRRTVESIERGKGSLASLAALLRVIAPSAKRASPVRASWAYDPGSHAEKDKRFTPLWFLNHVTDAFGPIGLDPCAHPASAVQADRRIILPECGLASSWSGHRLAYVNPPFSAVSKWMARACDAWENHEVETIVMLVPARTDSGIFQTRVSRDADCLFLAGRIRFESAQGLAWPAPFSLMVVIWGAPESSILSFQSLAPSVRMPPWGERPSDNQSTLDMVSP